MGKYIFDHSNDLWYELHGDYFIPCLALEEAATPPLGIWGRRRLRYLKEHRPILYTDLMISGKLHSHLAEIDDHASKMLDQLIEQMAKQQGIIEQLKAQNQMPWVQSMNNICTLRSVEALASLPLCFDPGDQFLYGLSYDVIRYSEYYFLL